MKPVFKTTPALRMAQRILSALFVGMILFMIPFGHKLDGNSFFGVAYAGVGIVVGSAMLYVLLCLPLREARQHRFLRIPFVLATLGVIISPLHIPLWCLLTGEFPPNHFASWTIWVLMPPLVLSLLGPIIPIMTLLHHAELERKQERLSKLPK